MLFPDVTHTPILPIYQRISFFIYIYQRISCFFSPRQTHDGSSLSRVGGALGWCGGDAGDPHRRHHVQRFHTHRPDARHRVPGRNAGPILAGAFSSSSIWPLLNSPTHTPFPHMPHPVSPICQKLILFFRFFHQRSTLRGGAGDAARRMAQCYRRSRRRECSYRGYRRRRPQRTTRTVRGTKVGTESLLRIEPESERFGIERWNQ